MSDSDEELLPPPAKVRAPNRHRFKTVAQRIDEVDVDVYRRVGKVRSAPLSGSACFFQESLTEWRELNAAADWLAAERQLRPLAQSLPLLLHHKQQILDVLLAALRPEASLSLPPLFDLLVALARDLQGEMGPLLPAVWGRFTWLVSPTGGAAASDPDLLQAMFNAAAGICKALAKQLTAALPATLKHTARLRYHHERHVRCLAAETLGFLLRQASGKQLRAGLRALLGEAVVIPTAERAHGAGLLVAEAVLGVEHGLHSKAAGVLQLLLQEDLLQPEDFGGGGAAAAGGGVEDGTGAAPANGAPAAAAAAAKRVKKAPKGLTREVLRVRCTAVAAAAFNRLWEHTRRGHTSVLWDVLMDVLQRQLAAADAKAAEAASTAAAEAVSSAARAVMLIAQGVHYFRGSRVEDYAPLITLSGQLVALLPRLQQQQPKQSGQPEQPLQLQSIQQQQEEHAFTAADFSNLTVSHATSQLVLGVVLGHTKEVGASKGMSALKGPAVKWIGLFSSEGLSDHELLGFIQGLLVPPSTAAAAELFAPQLLGALGRIVLQQIGSTVEAAGSTAEAAGSTACDQALAMLIEVCEMLRPAATVGSGLPLLLTAQPGGVDLAAAVRQLASSWRSGSTSSTNARSQLLYCWAGLQLLPHACVKAADSLSIYSSVMEQCAVAVAALQSQGAAREDGSSSNTIDTADLLRLRGMALTMLAQLLPSVAPLQLPAVAADALNWMQQHQCRDYATVSATAMVLEAVKTRLTDSQGFAGSAAVDDTAAASTAAAAARQLLAGRQLPAVIELLLPCLTTASQKLRAAALQLLCCFEQPPYLGTGGAGSSEQQQEGSREREAFQGLACDVLSTLRDIHLRPCSVEAGRRWAVALERMTNHLEYGRVPSQLQPALVAGLIGTLHIRFSPLWVPASHALGEALTQNPDAAWPLILTHITHAQQQFLAGKSCNTAEDDLDHTAAAAAAATDLHQPVHGVVRFDLQQQWQSYNQEGYGVAAAASGSCTDAANRLTHILKGLAGKTSSEVMNRVSVDWVPLLLGFSAAVTHSGAAEETHQADDMDPAAAEEDEDDGEAAAAAADKQAAAAVGGKRKEPEASADVLPAFKPQPEPKRQCGGGGLASALSREGLGALGFSIKAWRGVMMEWLGLLGSLKNPKKQKRVVELQEAVARQLLSTDPALQTAALRCLNAFKLPFLPANLLNVLLQLADVAQLRNGLVNIPMMFDGSAAEQEQQQDAEQRQQQRQVLKGKKGGNADVGRVDPHTRPGFVPLLTMVLYPKMSKRSGRLGGRGAPGSARAAVLNALAALEPAELTPLMELLLMPISGCFKQPPQQQQEQQQQSKAPGQDATAVVAAAGALDDMQACRLIPAPWWSAHMTQSNLDWWLTAVDRSNLAQQPLRRRQGFLNAFEDLLQHLGYRLQLLLPVLLSITLHLLTIACVPIQQQQDGTAAADAETAAADATSREEGRAIRSQCLRLLAQVFTRFPAALDLNPLWPDFFTAVAPLMPRLVPEAVAAAPPALLAAVAALAANPGLARVLGDLPSQQIETPDEAQQHSSNITRTEPDKQASTAAAAAAVLFWPEGSTPPIWATQGLGGKLLSSCIAVLGAKGCSDASRSAALSVVEACLALQPQQLLSAVLVPWTGQLLVELKASVEAVLTAAAAAGGRNARGKGPPGRGHQQKRPSVVRQLALMQQLGQHCTDTATAVSLAAALVSLLQSPNSSKSGGSSAARAGGFGGKRVALDEKGIAKALGALSALWTGLAQQQQQQQDGVDVTDLLHHWEVMSLLFGQLGSRDARTAAAAAMQAASTLISSITSSSSGGGGGGAAAAAAQYQAVAAQLVDLNSWSADTLDEPDYNKRLACYSQLQPQVWCSYQRLQMLPLLLQCFFDLRNGDDLAIRQAAAAALGKAVAAVAELDRKQQQQQSNVSAVLEADDPMRLLPRVIYPQAKTGLRSNNLSVRQEHAALLRELVLQLPARFPDLLPLTSKDPEQDFFLNITHLQIHRRGRALVLLSRLAAAQQQQQQQQGDETAAAAAAGKRRKLAHGTELGQQQQQSDEDEAAAQETEPAAAAASRKRPRQEQEPQQQQQRVSIRVLMDIAAPLLQQFIMEGAGASAKDASAAAAAADNRGGHVKKQSDADREGAVADNAIDALREMCRQLGWQQYSGLLQRWLKLMTQNPKKQVIRATCAVLDAFHFDLYAEAPPQLQQQQQQGEAAAPMAVDQAEAAAGAGADYQQRPQQEQDSEAAEADLQLGEAQEEDQQDDEPPRVDDDGANNDAAAAAVERAAAAADVAAAARQLLQSKVLPVLQSQLVVDDQEVARAPVALALIKLIKLLPADVERIALPRCLTSIAGLLRSRLHSSRDAARAVLTDLSLELGPEYLPTIVNVLRAVLPDKGYTAHVLGFTAAALLQAHVEAGVAPGQLDDALELLLPTLEGDLFGQVSEAKEVTAFAGKYKEAKRCRAYEAYQHLAAAVTFDSHINPLLQLVRDKLPSATSPSIRSKLEQLLTAAARGVAINPSVTGEGLAQWIGGQLDACLKVEEAARVKAKAAVAAAVSLGASKKTPKQQDEIAAAAAAAAEDASDVEDSAAAAASGDGSAHLYLLVHFSLTVLNSSLKKGVLAGRDPDTLQLLDPLLPLLVRCLYSRHLGSVQAALKALTLLVGVQQLPGLPAAAAAAGKGLSSLLRKVPDAGHPLAQDCFRLLGAMLRDCPSYNPPTPQIRFLLKWIAADLQSGGTATSAAAALAGASGGGSSSAAGERVSGYGLLRAVLGRRLLVPEVYDVMDIVQKQMVTSHSPPGRATAAAALLQFLLDYPLSPARLQGHVAFLLTNTAYEHETGRLQALEMLQQVLVKFPPEVIANLSTTAYLPLITRLANETSPKARTAVAATLKLLHKQLQPQQNDQLASFAQQWLLKDASSSQQQQQQLLMLRAAAAHALGLLAEAEGPRFGQRRLSPEFLGQVVPLLADAAAAAEQAVIASLEEQQQQQGDEGSGLSGGVPRWQEVYHILLMLEKATAGASVGQQGSGAAAAAAAPLMWQQGQQVQQFWQVLVQRLLLHPHLWVRKAAARLLGLALATPGIVDGLISAAKQTAAAAAAAPGVANGVVRSSSSSSSSCSTTAGHLALTVYQQMEADIVDEGLCTQAVKCLVALAKHLAAAQTVQQQQQEAPAAATAATAGAGTAETEGEGGDSSSAEEEEEDEAAAAAVNGAATDKQQQDGEDQDEDEQAEGTDDQEHEPQVTFHGLIMRMVRLAEDTRLARQLQRLAALRWIAAAAAAVGTAPLLPHLSLLLRPLYRIAEATGSEKIQQQANAAGVASSGTPEEVRVLSEQVLAHLRTLFGSEQMLAAYTAAREAVRAVRAARKTAAARRVLLDPEAASKLKLKKGRKKSEARQRKAEERRRQRAARGSGGFGYKASKGVGKGKRDKSGRKPGSTTR